MNPDIRRRVDGNRSGSNLSLLLHGVYVKVDGVDLAPLQIDVEEI